MIRYLYTATAFALALFYAIVVVTASALLRLLSGVASDEQTRQVLATGLGLLVVAGPLWWLHWRGLRWQVTQEAKAVVEKQYRTYLMVIVSVLSLAIFSSAGASVTIFMRLALGLSPVPNSGWNQGLPWLVAMLTATILWWLHWQPLVGAGLGSVQQQQPQRAPGRTIPALRGVSG